MSYEISLQLRNLLSAPLMRVGKNISDLTGKVVKFDKTIHTIPRSIDQLSARMNELTIKRNKSFSTKEIKQYNREIGKTQRKLQKLENLPPDNFFTRLKKGEGLLSRLAGPAIAYGFFRLTKGIASSGMEMEQTRISFETMLKDGKKASKLIDDLNEFSNITPFKNEEVLRSSKVLLTAQVTAENMTKTLKTIGDVAAGAGVPLNEMSQIYAKAMNKGRLQAEELNQLAERGVPILQTLSEMYGVTTQEVMKMGEKGEITSDVMNQAFEKMTTGTGVFANMMEKQSQSTSGRLSTLLGKLQLLGIQLGEKLLPVITRVIERVIPLVEWMSRNTDIIEKAVPIVLSLVAAMKLFKTINMLTGKSVLELAKSTKIFGKSLYGIPIFAVIGGIVALVGVVKGLKEMFDKTTMAQKVFNKVQAETERLMIQEKQALDSTARAVMKTKEGTEERAAAIQDVNDKYGEYLPHLLDENATVQELAAAYKAINDGLRDKIMLQALNQQAVSLQEELIKVDLAVENIEKKKSEQNLLQRFFSNANMELHELKSQATEIESAYDSVMRKIIQLENKTSKSNKLAGAFGVKIDGDLNEELSPELKDQFSQITGGGNKIVNVSIGKLVETLTINSETMEQGAEEAGDNIMTRLIQAVNGVNQIQTA
jgi:tape measure domain-containing protein